MINFRVEPDHWWREWITGLWIWAVCLIKVQSDAPSSSFIWCIGFAFKLSFPNWKVSAFFFISRTESKCFGLCSCYLFEFVFKPGQSLFSWFLLNIFPALNLRRRIISNSIWSRTLLWISLGIPFTLESHTPSSYFASNLSDLGFCLDYIFVFMNIVYVLFQLVEFWNTLNSSFGFFNTLVHRLDSFVTEFQSYGFCTL